MQINSYEYLYTVIENKMPNAILYGGKHINEHYQNNEVIKTIDTLVSFEYLINPNDINNKLKQLLSDPIDLQISSLLSELQYKEFTHKLINYTQRNPFPELDLQNKKFYFQLKDLVKGTDKDGNLQILISSLFIEEALDNKQNKILLKHL